MNAEDSDGFAYGASDWFEVRNATMGLEAHASVFEPNRKWSHQLNSFSSQKNSYLEIIEVANDHPDTTTS
jgi:hypothetical protein